MELPRPKRELWLYGLAFMLALLLRLVRLGYAPLTDIEAGWALQALEIVRGTPGTIGPNSAYTLLTSGLFFIFESSNFLARLAPALAGSFLVLTPALFKHYLKPLTAIILAFFLAFDPGLLAISRQAGSGILSIFFLVFAWGFWQRGSTRLAAVFLAGALFSGPLVWMGLLGLGLSWAIYQSLKLILPAAAEDDEEAPASPPGISEPLPQALKGALPTFLAAFFLFGTLFFLVPRGISGALDSIVVYARGWVTPVALPNNLVLVSILFYQPLALFLGLIGLVRGWMKGSRLSIGLSLWLLVALLLVAFYPSRTMNDLAWALLPLLGLAAVELSRHFDLQPAERIEVGGVVLLIIILFVFSWLDLATLPWNPGIEGQVNVRVWLLFAALLLLVISLLLIAVGWSIRTARLGTIWGLTLFFGLFTIAAGLAAAKIRVNYTSELWAAGAYPAQADLLAGSIAELSEWNMGQVDALPVTIYQLDSDALRWALRSHTITEVNALDPASSPPILITPFMDNPGVTASYRGQDFTWNQEPVWNGTAPGAWLKWMVIREMPQEYHTVMLWARDDLFLDGSTEFVP